ncbi:MAG: 50S ribosomal protein L21 [candidate division WOR-3 bacterium]
MKRFAVIELAGKQFRVSEGDRISVDAALGEKGQEITIKSVLAVSDGKSILAGKPYIEGASVLASVEDVGKSRKIRAFKYKRRTRSSRRKLGHRQAKTSLLIKELTGI